MKTIAIVNQKGGCGKTTVSINLASTLAELGQRVLLVDMDPQSHCAVGLAVPEEQIEQSIYDVLISRTKNEPIKLTEILWQISDGLELAPASIDLSAFEQQMTGIAERESCLKDTLKEYENDYDYTIIDCPPAVSLLTFNALRAATDILVPVETGYFALHGLSKQLETLSVLCRRSNQDVNVKILATMYDIRTKMAREILADLRNHFGDKMFETIVTFNTKIKEASSFGQPISEYDPASKGQKDFRSLAAEVLSTQTKQQRHDFVNSLSEQLDSISITANELLQAAAKQPEVKIEPELQYEGDKLEITLDNQEFSSAEGRAWEELEEEVINYQTHTEEELAKVEPAVIENHQETLEEKLSDYYGVDQVHDAVVFVTLYPRAENVHIAGDFNNWRPELTKMQKVGESGVWQTKLELPVGRYRYRYVVDGKWQQDPYNEKTEMNPYGELNSIFEVK
ncbi:MAG: AAA family ATPase [Sedimentisphaerales bacterium]|nr:AAA family ATPase [Sedimentisphaerales bacterium]